jgi:hypothetical protein
MEHIPWEAGSRSASKQNLRLLLTPKVESYRVVLQRQTFERSSLHLSSRR